MKSRYPTPIEIMKIPVAHRKDVLRYMQEWKKKYELTGFRTSAAIADLLFGLAKVYRKTGLSVAFNTHRSYYHAGTIHLQNLSLITALHEFSHFLYGSSERTACRWSVWLFRKIFPDEFEQLKFQGHLLVKNPQIIKPPANILCPHPQAPGLRPILLPPFVNTAAPLSLPEKTSGKFAAVNSPACRTGAPTAPATPSAATAATGAIP